jgi:hypothetical protein
VLSEFKKLDVTAQPNSDDARSPLKKMKKTVVLSLEPLEIRSDFVVIRCLHVLDITLSAPTLPALVASCII